MRVLLIASFPPPIHGMNLANKAACDGLDSRCDLTAIDTTTIRTEGALPPLLSLSRLCKLSRKLLHDLYVMLRSRYDVFYMSVGMDFVGFLRYTPYMIMAKCFGTPYVIHAHQASFLDNYNKLHGVQKFIVKRAIKGAARVIVLGDSLRFMFEGLLPADRIVVCENGVGDENFITAEQMELKLNRNRDRVKLLMLSNIMAAKGFRELMGAFELLGDNAELHIAGGFMAGDITKEELYAFCAKYPDRVSYHSVVQGEAKKELLEDCDILILPSKTEAQPLSILEAYAAGLAVVTDPTVGGLRDIFCNEINGVACSHQSKVSISEAINRTEKKLVRYMATNYAIACKRFTFDSFSDRLYNILKDV